MIFLKACIRPAAIEPSSRLVMLSYHFELSNDTPFCHKNCPRWNEDVLALFVALALTSIQRLYLRADLTEGYWIDIVHCRRWMIGHRYRWDRTASSSRN